MKTKIISLFLVLYIGTCLTAQKASAQGSVSFQVFYDQLSPYGQWVNYPDYGYVWVPNAGSDFVPYSTGGHWMLTDYGWTWVSDYDWGWAPFHYGRWSYDNSYGWLWVPGNEWGPSWVTWRSANGYYGWAPMEPGISVSVSFGRAYDSHNDHWMFVRDRDFGRADINHYYVNRTEHDRIIRNSTVINKTYVDNSRHTTYVSGPARADVEKGTGKKINPVAIRENNKPGQAMSNGQLQIYRPQVKNNNGNGQKPAPSKVANLKDVKPVSQRNSGTSTQKAQQPTKQQPSKKQQTDQPAKQQTSKQPQTNQPVKQQPSKQQQTSQPTNQQPSKQQKAVQPVKQQPSQQQHTVQPSNQQSSKQQQTTQPTNQQPLKQQNNVQPVRQQPSQQQHTAQPSQPRNVSPSNNKMNEHENK